MSEPTQKDKNDYCGNCHESIFNAQYCSKCGQKNSDGRISIGEFFSVVFGTVFNLESKFFQTIRDIFSPGKLTIEWFKGRHKPYFHPVRLFIVTALLFIAALSPFVAKNNGLFMTRYHDKAQQETYRKSFIKEIDNYATLYLKDEKSLAVIDSLSKTMRDGTIHSVKNTILAYGKKYKLPDLKDKSTEEIIAYYEDELGSELTDSILNVVKSKRRLTQDSVDMSHFNMIMDNKDSNRKIANKDFINLSPTEIADKYQIEGFYSRLHFKQKIRMLQGDKNLLPFMLGNSLWVILLMMLFLAVILKLLYFRHDYYYVEHLIFSFHAHSFAFILFALYSIFMTNVYYHPVLLFFGLFLLFIYLYHSLRNVYQQSRLKTLSKLLVANIIYLVLLFAFGIFGFIVSMFLF